MSKIKSKKVSIVMGSQSDFKTMVFCKKILRKLDIEHEVKIISAAVTLKWVAISFLQFSRIDLEDLPTEWVEEGLPNSVLKISATLSTTSFLTWVVAALSK